MTPDANCSSICFVLWYSDPPTEQYPAIRADKAEFTATVNKTNVNNAMFGFCDAKPLVIM